MGNFNRGDRGGFGGKKRPGNDRGFNNREKPDRPAMHRAICSECGRPCEVPFRPSGDKPVFCSDCFGRRESGGDSRPERRDSFRNERRDSNEFSFDEKRMFRAVCDKCHKECEVPFKPSGDKPVFCSDCFVRGEKGGGTSGVNPDQYKKQFETLNSKLDYILKILSAKGPGEKPSKEKRPEVLPIEKKAEKETVAKKNVNLKKEIVTKKEPLKKKEIKSKKVAVPKKTIKKTTKKKN